MCAYSAALHTHCRSLFAMSSEKENDDLNPVPSKKCKLSLSRKGKGRFSSVSEHQLTVMSKPQVPKNTEKSEVIDVWKVLTTSREYIKHQSEIYNPREYISYIYQPVSFECHHDIYISHRMFFF